MWARPRATRGSCVVRLAHPATPAPAIRDCGRHRHRRAAAQAPHTPRLSKLLPANKRPSSYHPDAPDCNALVRTPAGAVRSAGLIPRGLPAPTGGAPSYQIIDAQLHALLGDRTHGRSERIQTLRCQACGATFSTWRDTPLYRLKTASLHLGEVLTALALGSIWPPPCVCSDMAQPASRPG
jgi:hypothetical protein